MTAAPARTTDTAALALDGFDQLVVRTAYDLERAAAQRLLGSAASWWAPARVHDAIAAACYDTLSACLRVTSASARAMSARGVGRSLEHTPAGRAAIAALNGLVGDELRRIGDRQAITMAVRANGRDIACRTRLLDGAFPHAGGHLAVFVHGLCGNDESWSAGAAPDYPDYVQSHTEATSISIRYNSGLPVGDNGALLDQLLGELYAAWPSTVRRISLIGHGMGGVVVRAASHHAHASRSEWVTALSDIISLGSPVAGAGWERTAHIGAAMLRKAAGQAFSAPPIDVGHINPDEWTGAEVTRRWGDTRQSAAPLPHIDYRFVLPRLDEALEPGEPSDALSASLAGAGLLDHRRVAELLATWLAARRAKPIEPQVRHPHMNQETR